MAVALANQRTWSFFLVHTSVLGSPLFPSAHSTCLTPPPQAAVASSWTSAETSGQHRQDRKSGWSGLAFSISVFVVKVSAGKAKGSRLHTIAGLQLGRTHSTGRANAAQTQRTTWLYKEGKQAGSIPNSPSRTNRYVALLHQGRPERLLARGSVTGERPLH
jgi:hypothetical protein